MISVGQPFLVSVLVYRVVLPILAMTILFAGIYLESTRSRPRISAGRRVLVVGWLIRYVIHTIAMRGATDFEAFARSIMGQKHADSDSGSESGNGSAH